MNTIHIMSLTYSLNTLFYTPDIHLLKSLLFDRLITLFDEQGTWLCDSLNNKKSQYGVELVQIDYLHSNALTDKEELDLCV